MNKIEVYTNTIQKIHIKIYNNETLDLETIQKEFLEYSKFVTGKDLEYPNLVFKCENLDSAISTIKNSKFYKRFEQNQKIFEKMQDDISNTNYKFNLNKLKSEIHEIENPLKPIYETLDAINEQLDNQNSVNQKQGKVNKFNNTKSKILFFIAVVTALTNPNIFRVFRNIFTFFIKLFK